MKKTFDQLIAEGKRKRAERLRQVRGWSIQIIPSGTMDANADRSTPPVKRPVEPFSIRGVSFGLLLPDGTITPYSPANWAHKFFEETASPSIKATPDDNTD